jgi:hypothetical protein
LLRLRQTALAVAALLISAAMQLGVILPATAQGAAVATITGTVQASNGTGIAGADVTLSGPTSARTSTDRAGAFVFANVTPGVYSFTVTHAGFAELTQPTVIVGVGQTATVAVQLQPSSYQSLNVIGSTSSTSRLPLNTSTAAVSVIDQTTLSETGSHQVMDALQQIPGVLLSTAQFQGNDNGASANATRALQIRGALPYETQTLIDGHPVASGSTFSPTFLNPLLLDSIEVVKGPGYIGPDINYAINGTVNFRTASPTQKPKESVDVDYDFLGGVSSNFRATGTTLGSHLGYALDYAVFGTPGQPVGSQIQPGYYNSGTFNGQPLKDNGHVAAQPPGYVGSNDAVNTTAAICCFNTAGLGYTAKAELAKLVWNFSAQTSLQATYLGSQTLNPGYGDHEIIPNVTFTPGAGYTGSLAAGTQTDPNAQLTEWKAQEDGLFESEFRTSAGPLSFLARYFAGAENTNLAICPGFNTCNLGFNQPVTLYGTGSLNGVQTVFNGVPGQFSLIEGETQVTSQHFRGDSAELDDSAGPNLYTISFDRSLHSLGELTTGYGKLASVLSASPPDGTAETFQTLLLRGQWALGSKLQANLGFYRIQYNEHFTPNGGVSFNDSAHYYDTVRSALSYRLDHDTSLRLSAGGSIAPPPLSLISTPSGAPVADNQGMPNYYTQVLPSGYLAPETSTTYDLGFDKRLSNAQMLFSGDVYLTSLRNQFLNEVSLAGTYTPTVGLNTGLTRPLYDQVTGNLGDARYEGIELSILRAPAEGFGFKLSGTLLRAYAYNLPANFYATGTGPLTTNLAIFPNSNYTTTGSGYNGLGGLTGSVPYSTGYAEVNWTHSKLLALIGMEYVGPNNSYAVPAFEEFNATVRVKLSKASYIQLSGQNLTNQLSQLYPANFSGIPTPLVNGKLGYTDLNNLGPATFNLAFHVDFGPH